ncbi:MFS transporter [Saccharopolyspora sp. NPDC050642]|uniref:MFS transporter n=1 Tax=Saccharopolyspora sp. NPDC050642 TaxID=3157099 RepID=UPI0033C2EE83
MNESSYASRLTAAGVVAVSIGNFLVAFDASSVNVALPSITASLQASQAEQQWFLDAYTIPLCVFLLTAGVAGDRFGVARVYRVSTAVFAVASLLCALPMSGWQLIAARVLQGASASFMLPMTLSILTKGIPDLTRRARAIGGWGVVGGVAIATAPLVGGLITQFVGWRWLFLVNIPVCAFALVLIRGFRDPVAAPERRFTVLPQLLFCLALTFLAGSLIEGAHSSFANPVVVAALVGFAVALGALALTQAKATTPLVPRALFTHRPYLLVILSGGLYQIGSYGSLLVLALFLQQEHGLNAEQAGYAALPCCVAWLCGNLLASGVTPGVRRRIILTATLIGGVGGASVAVLSVTGSLGATLAATALIGVPSGLLASLLSAEAMHLCPPEISGAASGLLNTSRQVGMTIAIAVLGGLGFAYQLLVPMLVVAGAFLLVGVSCLSAFALRGDHGRADAPKQPVTADGSR